MGQKTAANLVLVVISAIVFFVMISWAFERRKHWKAIRSAFRDPTNPDRDESEDDPYGIGMNDKDIL